MVVLGSICSCAVGISFPLNLLILNEVIDGFTSANPKVTALETMQRMVKYYMLLGCLSLLLAFIQMFCFSLSAKRQGRRIRLKLFKVSFSP